MRPIPTEDLVYSNPAESYFDGVYKKSLSGKVLHHSHHLLEKTVPKDNAYPDILEVGADSDFHVSFLRHSFEHYVVSDIRGVDNALNCQLDDPRISYQKQDATKLSFPDNAFDRIIACHVLEHLQKPHEVLAEWHRVCRPGGLISLILPCDPGLLWRFGRNFGPRKKAKQRGLEYDYWMAREHINSIYNLRSLIRYHFCELNECWWPCRIPFADINLIYTGHISVEK